MEKTPSLSPKLSHGIGIQSTFQNVIKIFCWKKEQTQKKKIARNFRLNYAKTWMKKKTNRSPNQVWFLSIWNKYGDGLTKKTVLNSGSFILKSIKNKKFFTPPPLLERKYSSLLGNPEGENHVKITLSTE